jgi:hypothetical protein
MKYDPKIPMENKYTPDETLAYNLLCWWYELSNKIFPNYRHGRIGGRTGDIRKTYIFKNVFKFVKEKKHQFKGFQYVLYIRAQLEVLKKIQSTGKNVNVDTNCLHGKKAMNRWLFWKKQVAVANNTTKATYAIIETTLESEFNKTKKTIKDILKDDCSIDNFIKNRGEILKYLIIKKISPLYILCSKWIKKLDKETQEDFHDIANTKQYDDYDKKSIEKVYNKYFENELVS